MAPLSFSYRRHSLFTYRSRRQYKQLTGRSLAWPWSFPRKVWDDATRNWITKGAHRAA